ncbi:hypothetical protein PRIPAC_93854 [Pristionchus pacificus]|uniref:Uncharacterized protein n=1 Tax=Pristionchus pacificus TaxID=54126 RepID=A0A2A6BPS5_PRIPA|nr:hypothetical protein PRIPAC_93854 [Pristionchus pacificus]|eukprot:PDM67897.1 hypothetical protein PRIPAC_45941 [Pristionchus pacificus]
MRRWLGLTTILALILFINGKYHTPLEDCPVDTVCLIFSHTTCFIDEEPASSFYVWKTEETTKTKCEDRTYNALYARLDITPVKLSKWKLVATLYEKKNGQQVVKPEEFKFKNAELQFIDNNRVQFSWNKKGESQTLNRSMHEMESVSTRNTYLILPDVLAASDEFGFNRFTFEIEANGEKWIDFIGPEIILNARGYTAKIEDRSIQTRIAKCDTSEIKKGCHGSCDQIVFTGQIVKCRSTLWFTKNDWSDDWRSLDQLNCSMGYWQAEWGGESVYVDSSIELECSASKPESPYPLTRLGIIIGSTVGGVVLLALLLVGVFFLIRYFKRREGDKPTTKRVPSFRICDFPSPLNESAKSPGDTVPEYTAHTFESKTLSEKTATAKLGKQSADSTGKKGRHPSTDTASMKFDTATFTPSFQDPPY